MAGLALRVPPPKSLFLSLSWADPLALGGGAGALLEESPLLRPWKLVLW